jgi:outer membrane protein TolC
MKVIALLTAVVAATSVNALTIDDYLSQVKNKNKTLKSYDLEIEIADEKRIAGDLAFSPLLTASYFEQRDKSLPFLMLLADSRKTTTTLLGLSKKFSTGTTLAFTGETYKYDYEQPVTPGDTGYSTGRLGISLTQSLWKDSFGQGTRLRHAREEATAKLEKLSSELKKRATLIQVESDYWDYLVALEDVRLRKSNLERAKKLDSWTSNRVYNGISDRSDLLQIKALVGQREIQLASAKDELESKAMILRENLDLATNQPIPELTSSLTVNRPYIADRVKKTNMIRIQNYLAQLEAQIKQEVSEEVSDSLRPDLSLVGKYYTSSYNDDYNTMRNDLSNVERPVTFVGVNFSWMFGSDALTAQVSSAKKGALSAKYRAEQEAISGKNAWQDYLRKYELTKQNVATLEKVAKLQIERSQQEQSRLSKGRTTTFNVVTAETESAEAEVTFLRAKSGLRKLEASSLLFTNITE